MTQEAAARRTDWWTALLVATLLGLPLLLWEFDWLRVEARLLPPVYLGFGLLVGSWLGPHRASRPLRRLSAFGAVTVAALPLGTALLMAWAMSG
ncbi:MAG TPA: hypothetical protein VIU15_16855 [Streptomyces sp.]